MKIVFIGSGNLATHLSIALKKAGYDILQVWSKQECNAKMLADKLGCEYVTAVDAVRKDADVYVISVKDAYLEGIASEVCKGREESIFVHTAGSMEMDVFKGKAERYGVLYPMQTFSKDKKVNFKEIPCFIESSDEGTQCVLRNMAQGISDRVVEMDSATRKKMHLAAVLASNLANHCYRLAEREMEKEGLDFSLLLPLIQETARKVTEMSPRDAQTGPMVRYDKNVMEMQKALLSDERTRDIYSLMAESIHEDYVNK